jgi:hypothetical protein
MKNKVFTFVISCAITLLIIAILINRQKSNTNFTQISRDLEKRTSFNLYYSGNHEFPTSVLLIENNVEGLFFYLNLAEGWEETSPYCGRFIKHEDDFFLIFPTCDSRVSVASGDELDLFSFQDRRRRDNGEMIHKELVTRFKKLAKIEEYVSTLKDFRGIQHGRNLPRFLQEAFTERSRAIDRNQKNGSSSSTHDDFR